MFVWHTIRTARKRLVIRVVDTSFHRLMPCIHLCRTGLWEHDWQDGKRNHWRDLGGLTKRAPDWRDSVAFSGFIYAQAESCSQAESTPARQQVTQPVSPRPMIAKPYLALRVCALAYPTLTDRRAPLVIPAECLPLALP